MTPPPPWPDIKCKTKHIPYISLTLEGLWNCIVESVFYIISCKNQIYSVKLDSSFSSSKTQCVVGMELQTYLIVPASPFHNYIMSFQLHLIIRIEKAQTNLETERIFLYVCCFWAGNKRLFQNYPLSNALYLSSLISWVWFCSSRIYAIWRILCKERTRNTYSLQIK